MAPPPPDFSTRSAAQVRYFSRFWRYYYGEVAALLKQVIPQDVSLVQVGSGSGELLNLIGAREKTGIDSVGELLQEGSEKYRDIHFIQDDFWQLRTQKKFDYILLSEITDSLRDVDVVFTQLRNILHSEGRLVIVTRSSLWRPIFALAKKIPFFRTQPRFKGLLKLRDMENMLRISGFEPLKYGRGVLCPVYIPLVSAFFNRLVGRFAVFSWLGAAQYIVARPVRFTQRPLSVSVVVAARNEEGNIEQVVERVPNFGTQVELVFVEGNSQDNTWQEIQRVAKKYEGRKTIRFTQQEGRGKWDAVKKGFEVAQGDLLMILDADMTVPPEDMPRFYRVFAEGHGDFINGSRMIYPMEKRAMRFFNKIGNRIFAILVSRIIRKRLSDTLCGTKVLRRSDWERIKALPDSGRDPFGDFELIFGASRLNLQIVELPVAYKERQYGETQINRWRDGWLLFKLCAHTWSYLRFS